MSLPYLPLYVDDYEADTAHLTLLEDGIYNRLLRIIWRSPGCSIPDDEEWIFRRMRVRTDDEKKVILAVIEEFLARKNGRITSPRLEAEFKRVKETHGKRSSAGKRGGRPKAIEKERNNEKPGFAFDKAGPKQPEPEPIEKREPNGSPKKGCRLPSNWEPDILEAVRLGLSESQAQREGDKFRDYWKSQSGQRGVKLDWDATWRNWCRKAQESRAPPRLGSEHRRDDPIAAVQRIFAERDIPT